MRGVPTSTKSTLEERPGKMASSRVMSWRETSAFFFWYSAGPRFSLRITVGLHSVGRRSVRQQRRPDADPAWQWGSREALAPHQLSIQSGVKAWTRCLPSGATEGSSVEGMERKSVPRGSYILSQSSRRM